MTTLSWLLVIGTKKIPVTVKWYSKDRYFVELGENCERGLKGETIYATNKEIQKLEQTTFVKDEWQQDRLPLFEDRPDAS